MYYRGYIGTYLVTDAKGLTILETEDYSEAYTRACNVKNSHMYQLTKDGWQGVLIWDEDRRI